MRRPAMAFGALAFLWACAATVHLLVVSGQARIATSTMLAADGGGVPGTPLSFATATGVWMTGLLVCVTLLAGMPLGIALRHPAGQRMTARLVGFLILGFCVVSGSSVGLPYLPTAILLFVAGSAGGVEPQGIPLAERRSTT